MKLFFFRADVANFGDELNTYMWPRLFPPGFLDEDPAELFLGIGSILVDYHDTEPTKYVLGAGYAGYTKPPPIRDGSWDIRFVRGPRTARALGLPEHLAICDSAILVRALKLPKPPGSADVAFIPHFESLRRGFWTEACRRAGIRLIDPTLPVETVIEQLLSARMVITEAMHGAIVADALRVPWVAVLPLNPVHHDKWHDWADSLGICLRPQHLKASSLLEVYTSRTGGRGDVTGRAGRLSLGPAAKPINTILTRRAAAQLAVLARTEPQLSEDVDIERATTRALQRVESFLADFGATMRV